jgi:hypothetical protein
MAQGIAREATRGQSDPHSQTSHTLVALARAVVETQAESFTRRPLSDRPKA